MACLALLPALSITAAPSPAGAQTADFLTTAAQFIGGISTAAPLCNVRDRPWGVRLAYKFIGAINGMSDDQVSRLPPDTQNNVLDALNQAQADARAAYQKDQRGFCATWTTPDRVSDADKLQDGTMAFW